MSRNEESLTSSTSHAPISSKSSPSTKLCHIVKRPDFEGYGFNLHSEKIKPGQFIGKVDPNSPAEAAGLKEGDRIVEVNGAPIGSETHKQVVQRIKAIASEVRLLLIDVDGKGMSATDDSTAATRSSPTPPATESKNLRCSSDANDFNSNNANAEYKGIVHEMPGSSANISSISVISTKRSSSGSTYSTNSLREKGGLDIIEGGVPPSNHNGVKESPNVLATDSHTIDRPSPLTTANSTNITSTTTTPSTPSFGTLEAATESRVPNPANGNIDTSLTKSSPSLQLPLTAAEMRAKLMSKKKYDPKNESVDLKKKFEIIQKL